MAIDVVRREDLTPEQMLTQLHVLMSGLTSQKDVQGVLSQILDESIRLIEADRGCVQLLDESTHTLTIAAERRFNEQFLAYFSVVRAGDGTACGEVLRTGSRVFIPDVEKDQAFEPHRRAARDAGFRAVLSLPMTARDGRILGVISTHWKTPFSPDEMRLKVLDLYARFGADILDRHQQAVTLQDVIDRLQSTSEQLREANAIKDQFMGLVSHELRTPLAIILGDARLLRDRRALLAPEDVEALLTDVASEAWRLNEMIGHLIGIARSDFTESLTEPLIVHHVVEAAISQFLPDRPERKVDVLVDNGLPLVTGDPDALQHVIANLLGNADKFTPTSSPILVRCRRLGDGVMVAVRDRGDAVPREDLEKIFEPFYRSSNTKRGLGLGLTLCRRLMEKQGGHIWARRRVGGGLSVSIRLPGLEAATP